MKAKSVYVCSVCEYQSAKWLGKCPSCGEWNTMQEHIEKTSSCKGRIVNTVTSRGAQCISNVTGDDESSAHVLAGNLLVIIIASRFYAVNEHISSFFLKMIK